MDLLRDLPQGKLNPRLVLEFDEISLYNGRFSKKRFIKQLKKLEAYFYFNKIPSHQKVGLVTHKIYYSAREWWFEFQTLKLVLVCL